MNKGYRKGPQVVLFWMSIPSQHTQNKICTYQNVSTVLRISLVCLYTHIPVTPNLDYCKHIHVRHPSLPSYKSFLCMCSIWGYYHNFIPSNCKSFIRIFCFALVFLSIWDYLRHLWPSKQKNHNEMANWELAAFCLGNWHHDLQFIHSAMPTAMA